MTNGDKLLLPGQLPLDLAPEVVGEAPWRPPGLPVPPYWPVDFFLGKATISIAFVGEAPGEEEVRKGEPFVGGAGRELTELCRDAAIERHACLITNAFRYRPPGNSIDAFCLPRKEILRDDHTYSMPPLRAGKYIRPALLAELPRLKAELARARPRVIVALGNTALWALTGRTGIGRIRGTLVESTLVPGTKVLPTYHPAAVLRDWSLRAVVVADLLKAKAESAFPDIRRPKRTLWLEPTLEDLLRFGHQNILSPGAVVLAHSLSVDIETLPKQRILQCLCICPRRDLGIVIPFLDTAKPEGSFWSLEDEVAVWKWLRLHLTHPAISVGGQNYLYDWQWLTTILGLQTRYDWDTLYQHHSIYMELPKALDFMASLHTQEPAWKLDRPKGLKTAKREDT